MVDLLVQGHGSIFLLQPASCRGRRWIDDHVAAGREEWAGAVVVEARFITDIVAGALADGLEVR